MLLRRLVSDISEMMWPEACMGCGQRFATPTEHLVCSHCLSQIPTVDYYLHDENIVTDTFYRESIKIEYGCCYMYFNKGDWTQSVMHNIKYFKQSDLAVKFGRIAALELKKHHRFSGIDYILPVPMHPEKLKIRGFNQAECIASGMSEVLQTPIYEGILEKTVNSKTQTFMHRDERIKNADKIFIANRVGELAHSHFLVVDDVFTTGSTLLVCTKKIHDAMPECRVSVFALAKA